MITIPVDMRVGGIEETITVTGESPVVDVQSAHREIVLDDSTIQAIPATRAAGGAAQRDAGRERRRSGPVGLAGHDVVNARSSTINSNSVAGEGRYAINGFPLTAARSGGFSSYVYDTVNADEIAITVGGGLGESDIGGPVMNIIPRSGGNTFSGSAFYNNAGEWSSGNNLTSEIQALNPNLRENPGVLKTYDWSVSYGGPIKKDRLWFFGNYRDLTGQTLTEGIQANANAGNPARWDWVGSPINAPLVQDRTMWIGRLMGQFGKHRVRVNSEYQHRCEGTPLKVETDGCHNRGEDWIGLGNNQPPIQMSPEATQYPAGRGYFDVPFYVNQGTWTMTASSQLLFEAGATFFRYQPIFGHPAPDGDTSLTSVTEQSNAINPATGVHYAPVANYRYRGVESWGPAHGTTDDVQATALYVTGANSMKFGISVPQAGPARQGRRQLVAAWLSLQPGRAERGELLPAGLRPPHGDQDAQLLRSGQPDRGRLTLQGALRYDRASSYAPPELNGTTNTSFLNPQPITIPLTPGVDAYNDITPRVGVVYDVFGTGRTALKFNWGTYPVVRGQRFAIYLHQSRCDSGAQRSESRLDRLRQRQGRRLRPAEPGIERRVRGGHRHGAKLRQAWRRDGSRS